MRRKVFQNPLKTQFIALKFALKIRAINGINEKTRTPPPSMANSPFLDPQKQPLNVAPRPSKAQAA